MGSYKLSPSLLPPISMSLISALELSFILILFNTVFKVNLILLSIIFKFLIKKFNLHNLSIISWFLILFPFNLNMI